MANWFNRVQKLPTVRHSICDMSTDYKTSIRIGSLIPYYVEECLPSDKFTHLSSEVFLRLAPMKFPLMHRIKIHQVNFFTPLRIVIGEDNYQDWLLGQKDIMPLTLQVYGTDVETENPFINSIWDYLGYDVLGATAVLAHEDDDYLWTLTLINPVPFFSYLLIVSNWYADSTIQESQMSVIEQFVKKYQDSVTDQVPLDPDEVAEWMEEQYIFNPWNVAYSKDYFNTARPTPQMGSDMYVLNRPLTLSGEEVKNAVLFVKDVDDPTTNIGSTNVPGLYTNSRVVGQVTEDTTIRDLWKKEMMQTFEEHQNSFGTRIRESLAAHFGVIISDKRLQIPQWCGSKNSSVQIREVIQTSASEEDSALGSYAGKGEGYARTKPQKYFCEEHGYMMSLLSLIPDNGYCRGEQRTLMKQNVFDFAFPEFNNIGWQDIWNGELFRSGNQEASLKSTFGYQPRYSEYRSHPSRATGYFRTSSLLGWHLNRNFTNTPVLSDTFLKVAGTDRIFNYIGDGSECPIFVDSYTKSLMFRPITKEPDSTHLY